MTTAAPPRIDVDLEQLVGGMSRTCELYLDPEMQAPCPNEARWLLVTYCDCPPGRDMLCCDEHAAYLREAAARGGRLRCHMCPAVGPFDLRPLP